ncbi:MAG: hypothetical protein J1E39_06330 [Eubacterium sp.]|nr:hypothetical protein [Eubacterium sp.]
MTNCENCSYYEYDEYYECYTCLVDLDEDEMRRFICGDNGSCPYYRGEDDYFLARKQ